MGSNIWAAYVRAVTSGEKQEVTAEKIGQSQGNISKWKTGKVVPDEAAVVAQFAQAYGRNVLEAFVAAGFLGESDAGRGLPAASRRYLAEVRRDHEEAAAALAAIRERLPARSPRRDKLSRPDNDVTEGRNQR